MRISYEEFEKVDLRSGTITKVEPFPRAKKNLLIKYGLILVRKLALNKHQRK